MIKLFSKTVTAHAVALVSLISRASRVKIGLKVAGAAAALLAAAIPANSASINFSVNEDHTGTGTSLYFVSVPFNLPAGFTNAVLTISKYETDDRSVMQLNGVDVASFGIGGPGAGRMTFTAAGPSVPYNFLYGTGNSPYPPGTYAAITSPFQVGANLIQFIVNDTWTGINDGPFDSGDGTGLTGGPNGTPGPSGIVFQATLTYDGGQVPVPAALPLFATGLGALGFLAYRRKRASKP